MLNFKKSLIIGASVLTLAPVASVTIAPTIAHAAVGDIVDEGTGRKVVSEYTLSADQVKQMADNMDTIKNGNGVKILEGILGLGGGKAGQITALAVELSKNAHTSDTIIEAGKKGKGVKVQVTDLPTHTSYSQSVRYTILE
ncbi:hypothetical protein [Aerococcus kribbianus]|uniref:DUF1002 domain-containing protein n=1 Tax=Aerococcus kribbianus TaxID=2999064 RepID=A0A9X3FPS5_9LACT|nr:MULTISPECIES: hypothetical protein [unclassified Aerococcus]MCZ0717331.1 hypothetical protein [Aerococcus sp. YH-aer221]MCZ0725619.1 hypothetical protein [Aerococcus sp. YH-aer222]